MKSDSNSKYAIVKFSIMIITLFTFFLLIGKNSNNDNKIYNSKINNNNSLNSSNDVVADPLNVDVLDNKCLVTFTDPQEEYEKLLENNRLLIEFYARVYKVDINVIIEDLKNRAKNYTEFNENNLGFLNDNGVLRNYQSKDLAIIDYFEEFLSLNPQYQNNKVEAYKGNKEYVEGLINYFTSVYPNVDYKIAISIGAAESGYYGASSMLAVNNIYGGMNNGKLIAHKNIEYGVMQYIRYLDKNYFSKGINTVEKIGNIYCPSISDNGVKVASSHWLSLVNNAMNSYADKENISLEELNNLQKN